MSKAGMVEKLKNLLSLQLQKRELVLSASQIKLQLTERETQLTRIAKLLQHEKQKVFNLQHTVDTLQEELTVLLAEERTRREQLDNERKSDIIHSLSVTVHKLEISRRRLEDQVENRWDELEKAKQQLARLTAESELKTAELKAEIEGLKVAMVQQNNQLPELEAAITKLLNSLPEAARLHLISMDNGEGCVQIAELINGACGNCFYPLTEHDLRLIQSLHHEELMACKNCFTVLCVSLNNEKA